MGRAVHLLDQLLYARYRDNWDALLLRDTIARHVDRAMSLLDLGAGAGSVAEMDLRGLPAVVHGVDPDPRVLTNPYVDQGRIGQGEALPYADGLFDVVVSNNVLEHLENPVQVFREVARVLKLGGTFICKTPNRRHYVPVIAAHTPYGFHRWINRRRGRDEEDTFPTHYRANTPEAIRALAAESGFAIADVLLIEGRPEYLRLSVPTYLVGWAYERWVNLVPGMHRFRCVIIAVLKKIALQGDEQAAAKAACPKSG